MKRRLYLAGPMTGIAEFNHPAFHQGADKLRVAGYSVFSPAEHDLDLGINVAGMTGTEQLSDFSPVDIRKVLGDDLAWITGHADGIALLDGWINSKGTGAEVATAVAIGVPVMPVREWVELHLRQEPQQMLDFWTEYVYSALRGTLPVGMAVPA